MLEVEKPESTPTQRKEDTEGSRKTVLSTEEDTSGVYFSIGRKLINGIASLFRKEPT